MTQYVLSTVGSVPNELPALLGEQEVKRGDRDTITKILFLRTISVTQSQKEKER
jgi:hypothetical protein